LNWSSLFYFFRLHYFVLRISDPQKTLKTCNKFHLKSAFWYLCIILGHQLHFEISKTVSTAKYFRTENTFFFFKYLYSKSTLLCSSTNTVLPHLTNYFSTMFSNASTLCKTQCKLLLFITYKFKCSIGFPMWGGNIKLKNHSLRCLTFSVQFKSLFVWQYS